MGIHGNVTSDRLLTTMFLLVMVALGGPVFIGTAASDGSPWDWFLLTVWVCAVLGAAWTTRRAWRTPFTPGMASETCPASSLTEKRQLSANWLRTVWLSALLSATLAGGYVGAVTSTTIAGGIAGAIMAVPAGAIGALIIVGTGALFLRAASGSERRASDDRRQTVPSGVQCLRRYGRRAAALHRLLCSGCWRLGTSAVRRNCLRRGPGRSDGVLISTD